MKILLLGDYSNVHAGLADGLRQLGHEVIVASDGDGWKDYPRDIDLSRPISHMAENKRGVGGILKSFTQKLLYQFRLLRIFWSFRNYDVVQIINPIFLPLRAERILPYYRWLRRHNKRLFLGAFGMDHYYVKACEDCRTFRYSDFNLGKKLREREDCRVWSEEWGKGEKGKLNQILAHDVDAIIAGLYEYWVSYEKEYSSKLHYIPFPIDLRTTPSIADFEKQSFPSRPVRFFIGIQQSRHTYKGTDILLAALLRLKHDFPNDVEIIRAENVPFAQYKKMLLRADVLLDQIYSYTPAMNALQAMASGIVVVSGAEPEHYALQRCEELRPIINVLPNEQDVYEQLSFLLAHREELPRLSRESRSYIERYHDHLKVAQRYLEVWQSYE